MLAAIRPDSWNAVLYIHVFGAMVLVASLVVAGFALARARVTGAEPPTRFAYLTLLRVTLPAYVVMRVGAQLTADKEHLGDVNLTWVDIGYGVGDGGALLLLIALVLAGLNARRARRGQPVGRGGLTAAAALAGVLIAAYVLAIFAMTAKPA